MDADTPLIEDKLIVLLVVEGVALVSALFMRRGRTEGEDPGLLERILFAGGILVLLASFLYLLPRGCQTACSELKGDKKGPKNEITDFKDESPGCSKSRKGMQDFNK